MDYDGDSSEDEDKCFSKKIRDDRENGSASKTVKTNGYSYSPHQSSIHNGNGHYSSTNGHTMNGASCSSSSSNGSSSRGSSPKNGSSNGKHNGEQNGYSNGKNKDKWHSYKMRNDSSEKIYTKASMNNKGWHESKDSASPSSYDVANGWSVSDNLS